MGPPKDHGVEMVLPNEIGYERVAMACSAAFAQMMGMAPDRIEDLKTVVAEAAINAMEHGNLGRSDARVTVSIRHADGALQVAVTDEGRGITTVVPEPDIEQLIENMGEPVGFGMFLINQLSDAVEFDTGANGGHTVRMTLRPR
jgi:serine/threonine-protein kinase RsbW